MKRVLVVEPHPQVLAALTDLVEEEPGYELVGAVTTVAEAMLLVSDVLPDVVLIDADTLNGRSHQLGELLPQALLVLLSTATEPNKECPESSATKSATKSPIRILKTAAPEFLRSLSA